MAVEVGWTLMRKLWHLWCDVLWHLVCDVFLLLAIGGFLLTIVLPLLGMAFRLLYTR